MTYVIRPMLESDAAEVLAIYQAGIDGGDATFETASPSWADFDAVRLPGHRFVAADEESGRILGWTAVKRVSERAVYAGVVEHAVYVHPDARKRGLGAALLT